MILEKLALLLSVLVAVCIGLHCKSTSVISVSKVDDMVLDSLWLEIDSLEKERLPLSALKTVRALKEKAYTMHLWSDYIKAVLYLNKLRREPDDWQLQDIIVDVETESSQIPEPARSIVYSYLAQLYSQYIAENYWRIKDRREGTGVNPIDLSITQLQAKSTDYYLKSIKSDTLKSASINQFYSLVEVDTIFKREWTSMYDILVFRALQHFSSTELTRQPVYTNYPIDHEVYLGTSKEFISFNFPNPIDGDANYETLVLSQKILLDYQLRPALKLEFDLMRLDFVFQRSTLSNKNSLYKARLIELITQNSKLEEVTLAQHALASFYFQLQAAEDSSSWSKARQICMSAIASHPSSRGALKCLYTLNQLETKSLRVVQEQVSLPNQSILVQINYRNVDKVYSKLVRLTEKENLEYKQSDHNRRVTLLNKMVAIRDQTISLRLPNDLREHKTEIILNALPFGNYVHLVASSDSFSDHKEAVTMTDFYVSGLAYLHGESSGQNKFYCIDRFTGNPIGDVSADWYESLYDNRRGKQVRRLVSSFNSDIDGLITLPQTTNNQSFQLRLTKGEDSLMLDRFYADHNYQERRKARGRLEYFTDRAIYRPGQRIHYKALVLRYNDQQIPRLERQKEVKVSLFDANGKIVQSEQLRSNQYGSISGSFIIPTSGLVGQMALGSNIGSDRKYLQVEEYKRPNFRVAIDPLSKSVTLDDSIAITGSVRSYAGIPLSHISVNFTVRRRAQWPHRPWFLGRTIFPQIPEKHILSGTTRTDANGQFTYTFLAQSEPIVSKKHSPIFVFSNEATAIDLSGESQSSTKDIRLGFDPYHVKINIPEVYDHVRKDSISIEATNLDNIPITVSGNLKLLKLESPEVFMRNRYWQIPDQPLVSQETFEDEVPNYSYMRNSITDYPILKTVGELDFQGNGIVPIDLGRLVLTSGHYKIESTTADESGHTKLTDSYFSVCKEEDDFVPFNKLIFVNHRRSSYQPGDTVHINVGSPVPGQSMLQIDRGEKNVINQWLANEMGWNTITIPITEDDRGGLLLNFSKTFDNRSVNRSLSINVPWTNKDLDVKFETLRNKIKPGDTEEVSIIARPKQGEVVPSEVLVTMYDASLDAFVEHTWKHQLFLAKYTNSRLSGAGFSSTYSRLFSDSWNQRTALHLVEYPNLKWFGLAQQKRIMRSARGEVQMMVSDANVKQSEINSTTFQDLETTVDQTSPAPPQEVEIRENLSETTFFYPHLETDKEGNLNFNFKAGDALTSWKIMAFAHTPDLLAGVAMQEVITQKELMITPNSPRFLRAGDEILFSAKVDNLTNQVVKGQTELNLKEIFAGNSLNANIAGDSIKSFSIPALSSIVVPWKVSIPSNYYRPIEYTIKAIGDQHSDAIRDILPVLQNRQLVTESMVLQVKGDSKKDFHFTSLAETSSKTLDHFLYTLEYSSSPIWYAVKALPYLKEFPHECTEQIFNRYYAHVVADHLLASNPQIKQIFDRWLLEGEALESPLSKNEELKTASLTETPWLRAAESEQQQRLEIGLLFEENNLQEGLNRSLAKLRSYQQSDGGFAWFPGGRSNWYITQYLLEGFGRLQDLGLQLLDGELIQKAQSYVHRQAFRWYENISYQVNNGETKWEDDHLSSIMLHYLYVSAHFPKMKWPSKNEKVYDYVLDQARKYWQKRGLYDHGLITLIFHQANDQEMAHKLLLSLSERAVVDEDLGMRWNYQNGFSWNQLPVETHTLLMEVYQKVGKDPSILDDLKIWLLNHKRVQHWPTTKATAAAIHTLLSTGNNWIEGTPVQITLNDEIVDFEKHDVGTLYVRKKYEGENIDPRMANISILNPNKSITWGAVYWQYFEDLDKIEAIGSNPFTIRKVVLREAIVGNSPDYVPVESANLALGDKLIVQLIIKVDRDMEFIHIKDQRAAGLEPIDVISKYHYKGGLGYYQSTKDLATHFFIDYLPKGDHIIQFPLRVSQLGDFSNGICTMQSMYAPEFSAHSEGTRLKIKPRG